MRLGLGWAFRLNYLLGWLLIGLAGTSGLQEAVPVRSCPMLAVQVLAANPMDFQEVCKGVQDAHNFFVGLGLKTNQPLVIEIADKLPEEAGPDAAACYMKQQQRIYMLTYRTFQERSSWFNVSVSRELYRSVASHEFAHFLTVCASGTMRLSLQAQEYVAYVVMFMTMNPDLRVGILKTVPGTGFDSELQITAIFYRLDPLLFGAESYRHFIKQENGTAFLQRVLVGKALADE